MAKVSIQWKRIISADSLRRSSQIIAVHNGSVCVIGGELQPRVPIDSSVYTVSLNGDGKGTCVIFIVIHINH
jgi:hypothetical protein